MLDTEHLFIMIKSNIETVEKLLNFLETHSIANILLMSQQCFEEMVLTSSSEVLRNSDFII